MMWSDDRRWLRLSYAYGVLVAVALGYFLMRIPIQVSDTFGDVVSLSQPMSDLVKSQLSGSSFLRPGRYVEAKLVYELANGQYYYAFRLVHVAHVVLLVILIVRLLRPTTAAAALLIPLTLAVLIGNHTFAWTLREAFPINHYLTVVVACAAAANLAFASHRWWIDALAVVLFVAASLTIESGLLVWVVFVAAYAVGLRGVSARGVLAVTACLAAYFVLRFAILDVGPPTLLDREAGIGFQRYGGEQLQAMFGGHVLPFYAYNVVASIAGLLTAEPRNGIFSMTQELLQSTVSPTSIVAAVSSTIATMLVLRFVWLRRRQWLARRFDRADQLMVMFWLVFLANAAMGYAYTKDVIMAPAGVFFAVAVFVACGDLVQRLSTQGRASLAILAVLTVLSTLWSIRAVGIHAALIRTSHDVHEQWAYVDDWLAQLNFPMSPHVLALKQHLQDDAVVRHPASPLLRERWTRLFEVE